MQLFMDEVCVNIIISGFVQGVGFRYFALETAQALGLKGWVRNIAGQKVEALAQGEKPLVDEFINKMRQGLPYSNVTGLEVNEQCCDNSLKDFRITK